MIDQLAASVAAIQRSTLVYMENKCRASVIKLEADLKKGIITNNRDALLAVNIWLNFNAVTIQQRMAEYDFWVSELGCLLDATNALSARKSF